MLDRFKRAIEAGKAAASAANQADVPDVQSDASSLEGRLQPVSAEPEPLLALLALDETGARTPELVQRHKSKAKDAGKRALFIVGTASEGDFFSDQSLLCEYLPSHEDIYRATEERPDVIRMYRQHRLRLILDKWRVEQCSWTGDTAKDLVEQLEKERDQAARPVRFQKL